MNPDQLLEQFIHESREGLETIGRRLLDVERAGDDAAAMDDLFRAVHTLKGNCGLFEFRPLERLVHAAEDLLDRVRDGEIDCTPEIGDALLDAMDEAARLIDAIERDGRLGTEADGATQRLAAALRRLIPAPGDSDRDTPPGPAAAAAGGAAAPDWAAAVPAAVLAGLAAPVLVRYRPEAECFFKGEDPLRLAQTTPGLVHLAVRSTEPPPAADALDDWDCYRCTLSFVLVADAGPDALDAHFRYVPEQIESHRPAPAGDPLRPDAQPLWRWQHELLAQPGVAAGAATAARRTLAQLHEACPSLPCADTAAAAAPVAAQPPAAAQPSAAGEPVAEAGHDPAAVRAPRVLKVEQAKVDRLMDLIGEMVVAKNALPYLAVRAEEVFGQRELAREIKAQYAVVNRIAEDMQRAIMEVRMLPVGVVFQRFGRLVRDLSRKLGKDVRLVVDGEETEADKNVIEALADPLIHVLRNSLDHGLETPERRVAAGKPAHGTLQIGARQEGDRVQIEIRDDGAGVDTTRVRAKAVERGLLTAEAAAALSEDDAVQLVFRAGFSTADAVSDLSGRGVGMDVVRSTVERLNGRVTLRSVAGRGTTVTLSLPLSMAVSRVMIVEAGGAPVGVPLDLIVETVRVPADDVHRFKELRTAVLRGRVVPLRGLSALLGCAAPELTNADGEFAVLVLRIGRETVGLIVDRFQGAADVVVKPLDGVLAGLAGVAGTALMGDGSVLLVLDPKELL